MDAVPYIITDSAITLFLNKKSHTISNAHPNFNSIKDALRMQKWGALTKLVDLPQAIVTYSKGKVQVKDGLVFWGGQPLDNAITERILKMLREGFNIDPMVAFLRNLLQNPREDTVKEFYLFMEKGQLPITSDGHFLAYKKVRNDYKSIHDGKTLNKVGTWVKMKRTEVDPFRDNTCSSGLHFCSKDYLPNFSSHDSTHRILILKVNPKDVVTIPSDYNNTKGRACRYFVVGELNDGKFDQKKMNQAVLNKGAAKKVRCREKSCRKRMNIDEAFKTSTGSFACKKHKNR